MSDALANTADAPARPDAGHTAGPTRLRFVAASRRYGDGSGVGPVDLDVGPDRLTAVVGPSGCGKSTLLRLAAGLEEPTAGSIGGRSGRVGYVFQEPRLLPWLTARANVALPLELAGRGRDEREEAVEAALALAGLPADSRDKRPHELSGGMRMRVAIARAVVDRPDVLLLDEPFGALDSLSRDTLDDELRTLWLDRRVPTLFVTHDVAEAVYVSDRVVVLAGRPGRVAEVIDVPFGDGRRAELRGTPAFAAVVRRALATLRRETADGAEP
ncbi:MAG: ABC transporter ATP-binding protein [Planctomycetota bacterium]